MVRIKEVKKRLTKGRGSGIEGEGSSKQEGNNVEQDISLSRSENIQVFARLDEGVRRGFFENSSSKTLEAPRTSMRDTTGNFDVASVATSSFREGSLLASAQSDNRFSAPTAIMTLSQANLAQLDSTFEPLSLSPSCVTESSLSSFISMEDPFQTSSCREHSCDLFREQVTENVVSRSKHGKIDSSDTVNDDLERTKQEKQRKKNEGQAFARQEAKQLCEFLRKEYKIDINTSITIQKGKRKGKRIRFETVPSVLKEARRLKPELKSISDKNLRQASYAYTATLTKGEEILDPYLEITPYEVYHKNFLLPTYQDSMHYSAKQAFEGVFAIGDDPEIPTVVREEDIKSLQTRVNAKRKHEVKNDDGKSLHALAMTTKLHEERDVDGKSLYALAKNEVLHAERDADGKSLRALAWNKALHAERDADGKSLRALARFTEKDPKTGKSLRALTMNEKRKTKKEEREFLEYIGFDEDEELIPAGTDTNDDFLFDLDTTQNKNVPSSPDSNQNIDPSLR